MRCPRNVSIHFVLCKLSHSSRHSNRLCRSDIQCQAVTDPLLRLDQKNRLHARVSTISTPLPPRQLAVRRRHRYCSLLEYSQRRSECSCDASTMECGPEGAGGGSMSCERCGGLMILEHGFSVIGLVENPEVDARRCLNCGNMIDATILANRASACKQNSGEHHAMPVRHPRTHQPVRLNRLPQDRTLQTEGVIAECPRGHAPHPPVGAPSVQTPQFESAHLAPHSPRAAHQRRCI